MATMMKRLRLIYALLLALPLLVACTSDDSTNSNETQQDGKITVHLRLSQAGSTAMRWEDQNAEDDEMMNIWTVVVVEDATNNVVAIYTCKPSVGTSQEIDEVELPNPGVYRFYSFANIGATQLNKLLDLGDVIPTSENADDIVSVTTGLDGKTISEDDAKNITIGINGNLFNPSKTDNGLGSTGIPMSNVQKLTVSNGDTKDLVVVRLLAKIELQVYNDKGSDVTIESVTLTDITKNVDNNLKLFPAYIESASGDENKKDEYTHGHIQPNLNNNITTGDVSVNLTQTTVSATTNSFANKGTPVKIAFYVNESATPTNKPVNFSHFFLKIKLQGEAELRYALIDDKGTKENEKWDYIARNDYRIIPIVLDDYKLDIIPYDFPAIGVHPASVKEEDGIYTATFHDYGHFHLVPQVTKYSDGEVVGFTATTPTPTGTTYSSTSWGLVNNSFDSSWGSWTDATKATEYNNATDGFYRKEGVTSPNIDADDAGGVPVWYKNDGSNGPQWQPNSTIGYVPFIFGYIADPKSELTTDLKVYHEFSINLYKQGTGAARQMTYRLYMILDTEQMLYRQNGAAPVRHTHGH